MSNINILWVDDEIEFLKPHIIFLEQKNYKVTPCKSGTEALILIKENDFDIVFLDENMPGLSGLETLSELKEIKATLPVVMITKSEEEYIMEDAIGNKIADYLIKPVNPNQILLSLKKNLDHDRLVSEKTSSNYLQEFRKISMNLNEINSFEEWEQLYKKLVFWELELESSNDATMSEILDAQKMEANQQFGRFIEKFYPDWFEDHQAPVMSHTLFKNKIVEELSSSQPTLLIVIDNLRYDQWKVIEPSINKYYKIQDDSLYFSILPTATQYARNAIFSGLMPLEMEKKHPDLWKNDINEGSLNLYENEFLTAQIKRLGLDIKHEYYKITSLKNGKELADNYNGTKQNNLTAVVYNFVDMLSHSKTEMEVIKELADDNSAYRSITESWYKHSPLQEIVQKIHENGLQLIITTDHGMIKVSNPVKVVGDKNVNTNLRYKLGKNMSYNTKEVFEVANPDDAFLPKLNQNTRYIFAKEDTFLAYPNNYNYYVNFYKDTFQHGGISMEEVIIPILKLNPK